MSHAVYDVYTNVDPTQLTTLASETFMVWLKFALGQQELDGKKLEHPSGRYAAALSWKQTGVAKVSIIADEDKAREIGAIEYGRPFIDMKEHMLYGGKATLGENGYLYRTIPLRPDAWRTVPNLNPSMIAASASSGRVKPGIAKMWAAPRPYIDGNSRYRTMSNNPNKRAVNHPGPAWTIPEFHPYAPGKILADILQQEFGR